MVMELTHYYATPTIYAFHESCCWKLVTASYFASLPTPNPFMLLMSSLSGIWRTQKWTDWNPASSKQSFISGKDHLPILSNQPLFSTFNTFFNEFIKWCFLLNSSFHRQCYFLITMIQILVKRLTVSSCMKMHAEVSSADFGECNEG